MHIHILQHVDFEGAGFIASYLEANHHLHYCRLFLDEALPEPEAVDVLIVMGGPMSANDTTIFPWLNAELEFVRTFVQTGKPILGICLGAQIIAKSLGGQVFQNKEKEIGWWPIQNTANTPEVFQFPEQFDAFHWHGETFSLPESAKRLASSAVCENQAFQIGRRIIGLQFHLETTQDSVADLIAHCSDELVTDQPYIQSQSELKQATKEQCQASNSLMAQVLDYLLRG